MSLCIACAHVYVLLVHISMSCAYVHVLFLCMFIHACKHFHVLRLKGGTCRWMSAHDTCMLRRTGVYAPAKARADTLTKMSERRRFGANLKELVDANTTPFVEDVPQRTPGQKGGEEDEDADDVTEQVRARTQTHQDRQRHAHTLLNMLSAH